MSEYFGFTPVIELVRSPRTRAFNPLIKQYLEEAYRTKMYPAFTRYMTSVILRGWKAFPKYKYEARVRGDKIIVSMGVDEEDRMGKIFNWVDMGTGLDGPNGSTYPIDAVNAPMLVFDIPYSPMSMPVEPLRYNPSAPRSSVAVTHIDHPGIQARKFSIRVGKHFSNRRNPYGFYRITENAYRRAIRRWQKMGNVNAAP